MGSTLIVDEIQGATTAANVTFPAGVVIQVVDSGVQNTEVTVQNSTFVDAGCTATITPKFATSKIFMTCTQVNQAWNTGAYATGRWRIMRNVGGGAFTALMQDTNTGNGNFFFYDYGSSGINCYVPMTFSLVDTPNTTSACVYKTQGCQGTNGGNRAVFNTGSAPGRMVLMEIAG